MSNEQHRIYLADILFKQKHIDEAYNIVDDILHDCSIQSRPAEAIKALETLVQKYPTENGLWMRLMALINTRSVALYSR
jgi:hypothetical protein